ncbi:MAG: hypothetical protein WD572_06490 [Gammaproteobacteria bacterium]
MTKPTDIAATAAYAYDGRGPDWQIRSINSGWHEQFNSLLGQGYEFVGQTFAAGGLLFRGMSCGFSDSLSANCFSLFDDSSPLVSLEHKLEVLMCSEQPRDALAVARPWLPDHEDAAVLVFCSEVFISRWQHRAAAMLAFADAGLVFKYPCLAESLSCADLLGAIVHPQTVEQSTADTTGLVLYAPAVEQVGERGAWQSVLETQLSLWQQAGLVPAKIIHTSDFPVRSSR